MPWELPASPQANGLTGSMRGPLTSPSASGSSRSCDQAQRRPPNEAGRAACCGNSPPGAPRWWAPHGIACRSNRRRKTYLSPDLSVPSLPAPAATRPRHTIERRKMTQMFRNLTASRAYMFLSRLATREDLKPWQATAKTAKTDA